MEKKVSKSTAEQKARVFKSFLKQEGVWNDYRACVSRVNSFREDDLMFRVWFMKLAEMYQASILLDRSFSWVNTPQRHEFWGKVHTKWQNFVATGGRDG